MKLSVRESQIMDLLLHGMTNKEIGTDLGISPHTVRDHISRMLRRHGFAARTALVAFHKQKPVARQRTPKIERRSTADRRASNEIKRMGL